MNVQFVCSAAHYSGLPPDQGPEICLLGRSNVGKSSFINHALADRRLARVSKKPGKTTLANFYRLGTGDVWVDLPGYGFADSSRGEQARWSRLMEEYCQKRKALAGIIWLLDARHPGLEIDRATGKWLLARGLPVLPVLTKCDKLPVNQMSLSLRAHAEALGFSQTPAAYSTLRDRSRAEFWLRYELWRGPPA